MSPTWNMPVASNTAKICDSAQVASSTFKIVSASSFERTP
jgi:hypothetical protein